jgi:hypothetical protein
MVAGAFGRWRLKGFPVLFFSPLLSPPLLLGGRDLGPRFLAQFEALATAATSLASGRDRTCAGFKIGGGTLNPGHESAALRIQRIELIDKGD